MDGYSTAENAPQPALPHCRTAALRMHAARRQLHTHTAAATLNKSERLLEASGKYARNAKFLNTQALLRKYGPVVVVLLFIVGGLWWRFR